MQLEPARYRTITIGALVALCVIIVTGAAVRLTGSGLGCSDWPGCNQERFVDVSDTHTTIEQLNRLFTGVIGVLVAAAVLGSLVRVPRRRDLTWLSVGLVAGVIGQILVGRIVVISELHPATVQLHFLLSMVMILNGMVLVRRAGEPDGVPRRVVVGTGARRLAWALGVLTSVVVVTGTVVTGTGPHAGDENARRFDFDISDVARIHGVSVVLTIATALGMVAWIRRRRDDRHALWGALTTWMFVAVMQAAVGYVQYFNGVPVLLVGLHIAGATLLYLATVRVVLAIRRPVEDVTVDVTEDLAVDHAAADGAPATAASDSVVA